MSDERGQIELWKLEKLKDWPVIATSVECPRCRVGVAFPCVYEHHPDMLRNDFHAERKMKAAEAYLAFQEESCPSKEPDSSPPKAGTP